MKIARTIRKLAGSSSSAVPASTVRPLEHLSAFEQQQHAALTDRAARIEARLVEIDKELPHRRPGEYVRQELEFERRDLVSYQRVTEHALSDLVALARQDERRAALVRANVQARERSVRGHVERLVAMGDFREARVHRMALIDVMADVLKELGGPR